MLFGPDNRSWGVTLKVNLLVGEQRSKAYLAVNPQGKVPAIRVQGECLWAESSK